MLFFYVSSFTWWLVELIQLTRILYACSACQYKNNETSKTNFLNYLPKCVWNLEQKWSRCTIIAWWFIFIQPWTETMWLLWPSSGKFFCSARSKQTKVIKKQNRMSHMIDTGLFGRKIEPRAGGRVDGKLAKTQETTRKRGEKVWLGLCVCTCVWQNVSTAFPEDYPVEGP